MPRETGWLIETMLRNDPRWWDGEAWNLDSSEAVRFCRRQDAEKMLACLVRRMLMPPIVGRTTWSTEMYVTEHEWVPREEIDEMLQDEAEQDPRVGLTMRPVSGAHPEKYNYGSVVAYYRPGQAGIVDLMGTLKLKLSDGRTILAPASEWTPAI